VLVATCAWQLRHLRVSAHSRIYNLSWLPQRFKRFFEDRKMR
jgi:hypothetical protein